MKNYYINISLFTLALILSGCDSNVPKDAVEGQNAQTASASDEIGPDTPAGGSAVSDPLAGIERKKVYVLASTSQSDDNCSSSALPGLTPEDMRCATSAQWKQLCQNATSISKDAAKGLIGSVAFDEGENAYYALEHLIDNNKIFNEKIQYSGSGESSCKISFDISGIYDGNSIDQTTSGHATHFLIGSDGTIYVLGGAKDY